jgi:hypothetical protein
VRKYGGVYTDEYSAVLMTLVSDSLRLIFNPEESFTWRFLFLLILLRLIVSVQSPFCRVFPQHPGRWPLIGYVQIPFHGLAYFESVEYFYSIFQQHLLLENLRGSSS